jgi:hypothetical protein
MKRTQTGGQHRLDEKLVAWPHSANHYEYPQRTGGGLNIFCHCAFLQLVEDLYQKIAFSGVGTDTEWSP